MVKSSYSNFNSLSSAGIEVKVDISKATKDIKVSIKGDDNLSITISNYHNSGVSVPEKSDKITSKATINISVNDQVIGHDIKTLLEHSLLVIILAMMVSIKH